MTLSQFEKIIKMSKFEFFSEYTNHGIEHIERVLMTAENLIGDSIKILTPRDITVLILSIVLHDLGMHITYEGFQTLLADQKNKKNTVPYFDQKFWHEEWSIYFEETKRWNENRLISTFGKIIEIKELSNDKDTLTEYDKKTNR
ncbi:HD domain-containing protein [Cohnella rhizosphaerae]|uniref:HD-CE domain-containing protein n=1 Tax=Cohnella rhizosphaerae TaxID=1457232 RepID=A0A9X4KQD7_9BACL|nr:hypothetical protein [Cohnella rhizosphaerae]MDG0809209.1 hypothetical protein [Cohnella rhizosphaerae]